MTKDNNLLGTFELNGILPAPRGVPKIDVTFDVDANGILNVSAKDQSTGRSNQITITNDKGRLSKDEIERMLSEAQKYAHEDEEQRERISVRNGLESYVFSVKQAVDGVTDSTKLSEKDKQTVLSQCNQTLQWLDNNSLASKDEFQHKFEELQKVCSPVMAQLHQQSNSHQPNSTPNQRASGPTVEEMD